MIFLNAASSAAALVFYLPDMCTHTDTEGKQRKTRVRNILKSLEKNTIFNEHPVVKVLARALYTPRHISIFFFVKACKEALFMQFSYFSACFSAKVTTRVKARGIASILLCNSAHFCSLCPSVRVFVLSKSLLVGRLSHF